MKMYKRIFGVLLCLCMLLGAVSLAGATDDNIEVGGQTEGGNTTEEGQQTHEDHPVCGKEHKNIGDHTSEKCSTPTWTKLYMDGDGKLCYGEGQPVDDDTTYNHYTLGEGNYYLDTDVSVTKTIMVTGTVTICLNGYDLTQATESNLNKLLDINGDATLNICNCGSAKGCIALTTSDEYPTIKASGGSTLNLFSGEISRENGTGAAVDLGSQGKSAKTTFNMYGGEVNQETGNYAVRANVTVGYYAVNIYGGVVNSAGTGVFVQDGREIKILITGGSVSGDRLYAVDTNEVTSLTLSGNPTLSGAVADIYLSKDANFTVTDDFKPSSPVSVAKSDHGVFAKPAVSDSSLEGKANDFVSAETGYCVTASDDGDLQLTPCEITQPTASNPYTVSANGSPTYRWYKTTQGDVPVTNKNAEDIGNYYWNGEWSISKRAESISNESIFSIAMKKGDTLTLSCENSAQGSITEVKLYNSNNEEVGKKETTTGTSGETIYKFTAPADGTYTLKLSASKHGPGPGGIYLSFTATVTGDVPDTTKELNTGATLNTANLCKGSYICRVTWQGKTDKGTTIIDSAPVTLDKDHTAAAVVHENETPATCTETGSYDEVVKCSRCGAEISRETKTIPAKGHAGGKATCTDKAICETCKQPYGELAPHTWQPATTTAPKTCSVCQATEGDPLSPRYYYNSTTATTKDTTKKDTTKSPGTFDPGVGVYALTAVLSVTGMAWMGRKKH